MPRTSYDQLMQQSFQAPKCYPMPPRSDGGYPEAELGMKIACGFEMIYQTRKREGLQRKGSTWEVYRGNLEKNGYFERLLPGSNEYKRLMENAEDYYRKSSLHSRENEIMSVPVRRINDIVSQTLFVDEFKGQEIPLSDDDSWLYNGKDELTAALLERQEEMEYYNLNRKKKSKSKREDVGPSSSSNIDDYDLSDIAKSMQEFIQKMSSFEGVEVPGDGPQMCHMLIEMMTKSFRLTWILMILKTVIWKRMKIKTKTEQTSFMSSYSDVLNQQLKSTTLDKSFVRASEQPLNKDEGPSNGFGDMDEEFPPVDVQNFLGSFSSQDPRPIFLASWVFNSHKTTNRRNDLLSTYKLSR